MNFEEPVAQSKDCIPAVVQSQDSFLFNALFSSFLFCYVTVVVFAGMTSAVSRDTTELVLFDLFAMRLQFNTGGEFDVCGVAKPCAHAPRPKGHMPIRYSMAV